MAACRRSTSLVGETRNHDSNVLVRQRDATRSGTGMASGWTISTSGATAASSAGSKTRGIGDEHDASRKQRQDVLQRTKVSRDERICRRDRSVQHADVLGGERQQQVLDAISRQDRQRPLGAQPPIEERLAKTPRSGNGIRERQACEGFTRRSRFHAIRRAWAPRQQRAPGRLSSPLFEPIGQRRRIVSERPRGSHHDRAISAFADGRRQVAERHALPARISWRAGGRRAIAS